LSLPIQAWLWRLGLKPAMSQRVTRAANLVLGGAASVCFLALLYFSYHYGWTGQRRFMSTIDVFVYYFLPGSLALLFFGSLRLQPALRVKLALVTFSTVVSLYAVEIILEALKEDDSGKRTLWTPTTKEQLDRVVSLARQYGVTYDARSQLQVVRNSRSQGLDAVPAIYPLGFFVRQPDGSLKSQFANNDSEIVILGGMSNRPTVFCNEAGKWITYQSDEHGFHNPRGIWSSPSIDVAVLGDSYAQGACVQSDRNFVAVIRRHFPATLNLAMSNTGPLIALADLKEYAARFRPRVVLWFLYEQNDFADLNKERNSSVLMQYLGHDFSQGLVGAQVVIDKALENRIAERMREATTGFVQKRKARTAWLALPAFVRLGNVRERLRAVGGTTTSASERMDSRSVRPEIMQLLAAILADAKLTVDSWGGQLYLVYLPERERYADPHVSELDERIREQVVHLAGSLGVPIIDIHSAFRSHSDPLGLFPFRRRGHYNEEGHRLVGEAVLRSLLLDN
jgi:hypothetical protein